ncbi:hypothetical protein PR048_024248 [Dryococelus australis]|uniref:DUF4817 domain-containing protein n=1 Tax=Dryococelus australis TaxID=614101 RepID=A0ABQ9GN17_9NEOP|nr:hypothetical protein PR048_024248 [Dryococelus australis]
MSLLEVDDLLATDNILTCSIGLMPGNRAGQNTRRISSLNNTRCTMNCGRIRRHDEKFRARSIPGKTRVRTKDISKCYWKRENVIGARTRRRAEFDSTPSRETMTRLRDKFEKDGTLCDVKKGRCGRKRTATYEGSAWEAVDEEVSRRNAAIFVSVRNCEEHRIRHKATTIGYHETGRGGVVVRLLASPLGETGSIPGEVAPGPSYAGVVQDYATSRRFSLGLPFPPPSHSDTAPCSHHPTLIGSQDLDVNCSPEYTHGRVILPRRLASNSLPLPARPVIRDMYGVAHLPGTPPRLARRCGRRPRALRIDQSARLVLPCERSVKHLRYLERSHCRQVALVHDWRSPEHYHYVVEFIDIIYPPDLPQLKFILKFGSP